MEADKSSAGQKLSLFQCNLNAHSRIHKIPTAKRYLSFESSPQHHMSLT